MPIRQMIALLARIPDGFAALDRDWRILDLHLGVRQSSEPPLEREARALIGALLWQALPELRGTRFERQCRDAMAGRRPVRFQDFIAGVGRRFDVHAYPSADGLSIYFHDITEQKQTEDGLRLLAETAAIFSMPLDYQERLASLAHLVVPALADWCIVDVLQDGTIKRLHVVHADPAKSALADAMRDLAQHIDEPGSPIAQVLRTGTPILHAEIHRESSRAVLSPERVRLAEDMGIRSSMIVPLIARGRTLGGLTFFVAESRRLYTPDHLRIARELAAHAALAVDNARLYQEAQAARAEAERRRRELERVMKSRALLMRGISHDVKNPVGAAEGYADLLERGVLGPLSPRQQEGVQRIRRSIRAALRLTHDLLEVARSEPDRIDVTISQFDVGETVRETVEDYLASARNAELELTAEIPEALPAIHSDPNRVRQVLGNLVSNALKYTPAGGRVTIRTVAIIGGAAPVTGGGVRIDIADTGPGIPAHLRERVFEEFVRASHCQRPGTGIGLAISRRISWALGADLTLESEVGRGSTFTLWLPLSS